MVYGSTVDVPLDVSGSTSFMKDSDFIYITHSFWTVVYLYVPYITASGVTREIITVNQC
jgi:hypothetical protein